MTDRADPPALAASPRELVDQLIALVDVEAIETDIFRGARSGEPWQRVFGGQVIAQALMSACRTVDSARPPHSLHAYFMRPGNPNIPILFQVSRDRDGGSFTSRRVVAIQNGEPILNLAASFQVVEDGLSHQLGMPDVHGPEGLANETDVLARQVAEIPAEVRALVMRPRTIEFRAVDRITGADGDDHLPRQCFWFRAVASLPDDPILQRVLLAYATDMNLLSTSMLAHDLGRFNPKVQVASLDHAVWIHGDIRLEDWHLYAQDSPWTGGARGMNRGLIYTQAGRLVASVAQEGLVRLRR